MNDKNTDYSAASHFYGRVALLVFAIIGLVICGASYADLFWKKNDLSGPFQHDVGFAYAVNELGAPRFPLSLVFESHSDSAEAPNVSRLILLEDGRKLKGQQLHVNIRKTGNGAFSHWQRGLIFSASDNSNPNANSRLYSIEYPVRIKPWFFLSLLFISILMAISIVYELRVRSRCRAVFGPKSRVILMAANLGDFLSGKWAVFGVGIFATVFHLFSLSAFPDVAIFSADTASYFSFHPMRTAGYPVVLTIMRYLGDNPLLLVYFQVLVSVVAILVLTRSIEHATKSSIAGLVVGVILVCKDGLFLLHVYIGPDSLFFSMVTLYLAFGLRLLSAYSARTVVGFAFSWAFAFWLRPSAIGLWPCVLIIVITFFAERRAKPALSVLGLMVVALLTNAISAKIIENYSGRGRVATADVVGTSLFATVGFILKPDTMVSDTALRDALVSQLAPIQHQYRSGSWIERYKTINQHYNTIAFSIGLPTAQKVAQRKNESSVHFEQLDKMLLKLSLETIQAEPLGYAEITAIKLRWQLLEPLMGSWKMSFKNNIEYHSSNMALDPIAAYYVRKFSWNFDTSKSVDSLDPLRLKQLAEKYRVWINICVVIASVYFLAVWAFALLQGSMPSIVQQHALGALSGIGLGSYCVIVSLVQDPLHRYQEPVAVYGVVTLVLSAVLVFRRVKLTRSAKIT
jgi:hypothetical protein